MLINVLVNNEPSDQYPIFHGMCKVSQNYKHNYLHATVILIEAQGIVKPIGLQDVKELLKERAYMELLMIENLM